MNIPDEAVEAAVQVIRADTDKALTAPLPELIRTILEAAAPYLMAPAWDEGMEWRAAGEYIPECEYTANPYRSQP